MRQKQDVEVKEGIKLNDMGRILNLLERFSVTHLYVNASMGQNSIAKALGIGNGRVNEILKGIKKQK